MSGLRLKRLLRISLRTVFVLTTILCVWLGFKVNQVRQQKEAVAWVTGVGGSVSYECDKTVDWNRWNLPEQLPGPDWLRDLIGVDYFASVVTVSLNDGDVHDLSPLYKLKNLRTLVVWGPPDFVSDEEIAAFEKALPDCELWHPCVSWSNEEVERNFEDAIMEIEESGGFESQTDQVYFGYPTDWRGISSE